MHSTPILANVNFVLIFVLFCVSYSYFHGGMSSYLAVFNGLWGNYFLMLVQIALHCILLCFGWIALHRVVCNERCKESSLEMRDT